MGNGARAGFTLVEINLVLLLFAVAITGLLGILPVGLKQGSLAMSDTICETFAENVLGQLRGNASELYDWRDWQSEDDFIDAVLSGVKVDGNSIDIGDKNEINADGSYLGMPRINLSYALEIEKVGKSALSVKDIGDRSIPEWDFGNKYYRATIWVTDSKGGDPKARSPLVADFVYMGEAL